MVLLRISSQIISDILTVIVKSKVVVKKLLNNGSPMTLTLPMSGINNLNLTDSVESYIWYRFFWSYSHFNYKRFARHTLIAISNLMTRKYVPIKMTERCRVPRKWANKKKIHAPFSAVYSGSSEILNNCKIFEFE